MNPLSDRVKPLGAVIHSVERRDVGQQYLRCADVTGRFLTPNVLLPSLQRHTQCRTVLGIHRNPDDAAWHRSFVGVTGGKKCCVGPAVTHGDAESLRTADNNVRTELCRGFQQQQR